MIIPAKFGLNTTNVSEGDVILLYIYRENKPRPLAAMFFVESKFLRESERGPPMEHSF
jgi:hypothetical protein